jgi:hypothetical protein
MPPVTGCKKCLAHTAPYMRTLSAVCGVLMMLSGFFTALTIDPFEIIQGGFHGVFGLLIVGCELDVEVIIKQAPCLRSFFWKGAFFFYVGAPLVQSFWSSAFHMLPFTGEAPPSHAGVCACTVAPGQKTMLDAAAAKAYCTPPPVLHGSRPPPSIQVHCLRQLGSLPALVMIAQPSAIRAPQSRVGNMVRAEGAGRSWTRRGRRGPRCRLSGLTPASRSSSSAWSRPPPAPASGS